MNLITTGAVLLLALSPARAHEHEAPSKETPRGVQSVDVFAEGEVLHLLTVEYGEAGRAPRILYSSSTDGGATFSAARPVADGRPPIAYANRGNDIPVAARGGRALALWPGRGTGFMNSGPVIAARSTDGGRTWKAAATPASDGTTTGHRFLAAAAGADGAMNAVWLDNRSGRQALYYARSEDGGAKWSHDVVVDSVTCECCWNRLAAGPDGGLFILYRGAAPRDMALAVSHDAGKSWTLHKRLGGFGWDINVCPHAGGGLALSAGRIHALVYNGKEGSVGLNYLSSADDGATWTKPLRLGGDDAHHADLAALPDGRLLAVWDTMGGKGAVYASRSDDGGKSWSPPRRLSGPAVSASHPRVAAVKGAFRAFWTEREEKSPQRLASAAL
jgi:hypothetical protein